MEHQDQNNLYDQSSLVVLEPDYGAGMRKCRGVMDLSKIESLISKLDKNTESLKKVMQYTRK